VLERPIARFTCAGLRTRSVCERRRGCIGWCGLSAWKGHGVRIAMAECAACASERIDPSEARHNDASLGALSVRFLMVGGALTVDRGKPTSVRAGRRVYGPGYARPSKGVRGGLAGADESGSP